jgi:signal transduction histidine kinase
VVEPKEVDEKEFSELLQEFISPLTAAHRWSVRLRDQELTAEQRELIDYIYNYCIKMRDVIPRFTLNIEDEMETTSFAHKLGGPIGGIIGFSYLLLHEETNTVNDSQRRTIERIEAAGQYLNALYLDLMNRLSEQTVGLKPQT